MTENPYASPQTPDSQPTGPAPPFSLKRLLFSFEGRINRAKYWGGILGAYAVVFVLVLIASSLLGGEATAGEGAVLMSDEEMIESAGEISGLGLAAIAGFYIVFIWVALALQVKRWHDRGKSGWMVLVNLIPIVGGFWALIECGFLSGTPGPNQYGRDPLA